VTVRCVHSSEYKYTPSTSDVGSHQIACTCAFYALRCLTKNVTLQDLSI